MVGGGVNEALVVTLFTRICISSPDHLFQLLWNSPMQLCDNKIYPALPWESKSQFEIDWKDMKPRKEAQRLTKYIEIFHDNHAAAIALGPCAGVTPSFVIRCFNAKSGYKLCTK